MKKWPGRGEKHIILLHQIPIIFTLIMPGHVYGYSVDVKMDPLSSYIALDLDGTLCSNSNSLTPIGCPTIRSISSTNSLELLQTPHVKELVT